MEFSRSGRLEERREKKRLLLAIVGSIAIVIFILLFGVKLLISFSVFVDKLHGSSSSAQPSQNIVLLPPTLNPLPSATNSAAIKLTGSAPTGLTLIVYVNGEESKKFTVPTGGTFSIQSLPIKEGQNTISAKVTDAKGNVSDLSNIITITIKKKAPILEISSPQDNATVTGDPNTVTISGKTEDDVSVTVNDRLVVTKSDNTFSYSYPLNQGDNKLKIIAQDDAGNKTVVERTVKYQK